MRSTRSPSLETQNSFERLQQLVKKEGKSARNLVTWTVPVVYADAVSSTSGSRRRGKSGGRSRPVRNAEKLSRTPIYGRSERMCRAAAEQFSGSALGLKEGSSSNRADVQARYWRYLFDNLFRAVDELYRTCEMDGSVIECQEVMMALDACHKDFSALIERIEMERRLETCPEYRPPGVAWEVRKTLSPSKSSSVKQPSVGVVRNLEAGLTWADRVRGKTVSAKESVVEEEKVGGSKEREVGEGKGEVVDVEGGTEEVATKDNVRLNDEEKESESIACEDGVEEGSRTEGGVEGQAAGTGEVQTGDEEEEADGSWNQLLREFNEDESCRRVSWADRCESPPLDDGSVVLADTPRSPGRAVTLHQRLSSPSKKRPIEESKRMLEEKQVRAQRARDKLVEEQKLRSKAEQEKVREAREVRESKMRAWREGMEEKLQKAEQLRESHLQEKRRKAHDEDAKVSEIAFINSLEAQNRKIEVLRRHQDHKARLADMAEERARRREEAMAREEAAQERRRVLEEERMAKLRDLDERRRDQVAKIEQMKQERERAREEAAQDKARERERRMEARNTALQLSTVQLEKKIQTKQDETSRRHDQQLEHIKEKAAGSRHTSCEEAPCVLPYTHRKWCTLCSVPIVSDVYLQSHERGRRHQEAVARLPGDHAPLIITLDEESGAGEVGVKVTQDHLRSARKRARKLRQRMAARWRERAGVWKEGGGGSEHRQRLQRCVKDLSRLLEKVSGKATLEKTGLQQLDRTLGDVARILGGKTKNDQLCFQKLGGVSTVSSLLAACTETAYKLPTKSLLSGVNVLQLACASQPYLCGYVVAANVFSVLVDLLSPLLPQHSPDHQELCTALLSLLAGVISTVSLSPPPPSLFPELMDCVSYLVSVGTISSISQRLGTVLGPLRAPTEYQFVISAVNLLVAASAALHNRVDDVFSDKKDDPTSLTAVLQETELVGLLRMLYAMLLHDGPPRHSSSPPTLPPHTLSISTASLRAINNFAILDLHLVQSCLGAEGVSLEFRHVSSYLMWHCSYHGHSALLQELILAVGYFSVLHPENQVLLQSGRSPTLLQLLCALPFEYFSNPGLYALLFPTLISACYHSPENRDILSQEISCQLLVSFLSSRLSQCLKPPQNSGSRNLVDIVYRFPQSCWQEALDFFSQ